LAPFSVLFDQPDLPAFALPEEAGRLYGDWDSRSGSLLELFVSSVDGVVALGSGFSAGSIISGKNQQTFSDGAPARVRGRRGHRRRHAARDARHLWTPAHVFRHLAAEFAKLRVAWNAVQSHGSWFLTEATHGREHPALKKGRSSSSRSSRQAHRQAFPPRAR